MRREFQNSHSRAPRHSCSSFFWDAHRCMNFLCRKVYFSMTVISRCSVLGTMHSFRRVRQRCAPSLRVRSTSPVSSLLRRVRGVPCMELCKAAWRARGKSNDAFVRALTKSSVLENLRWWPRLYGLSTPRLISQASLAGMSARGLVGSPANSNRPASCLPPSSPRSPGATRRRPF